MNVFSAGIIWDPREPLPPEYAAAVSLSAVPQSASGDTSGYVDTDGTATYCRLFPSRAIKEPGRNVLPAVSVSIEARITGDIAEMTTRQLFWNDAQRLPQSNQGSYTFPLPNGCTVSGFTCRIGNNKVLKATARPKGEAKEAFQQAVASHTTTALLAQNTPEFFTSSLGNIPPNTRVKIEIIYTTILNRRFGKGVNTTTLTIPTYMTNRYGQRPASLDGLNLETKPDDISLRIEILESEYIQSIKSASHEIVIERGIAIGQALNWDQIGKVTLKESTSWIETDFIISIDTICSKGNGSPEAWLEMHPSFQNHAAMMITLPPPTLLFPNENSRIGEILFVADRSGSMEDKMGNLRSAMQFFLKGIPLGRTFNLWSFGSSYESLWPKSREYGRESLEMALNYVDTNFYANMGGTEIRPALEAILAARDPSLPCDVVLPTDGEVWRLDETLDLVSKATESSNGAIRFFSLGLGAHVSHALVDGIAKRGGGYSEVIPRADKVGWEERVIAVLKAALTSHVRDVRIELGSLKAITSPPNLGYLNIFQAHRIFLILEQGIELEHGAIAFTLVSDGKIIPINASIVRPEKPGTLIHSLSARAILDNIERGMLPNALYQADACSGIDGEEADASHLAERIACKYSLASKWTSLFLLEMDNEVLSGGEAALSALNEISISRDEDRLTSDESSSDESATEVCAEKKIISSILSHQAFDGSIASGALNELAEVASNIVSALKDWLREKTNLGDATIDVVVNTALVVELLERDYKEYKELWVMILEKALAYIRLQLSQPNLEDEFLEYSRERLVKLSGLARLKRAVAFFGLIGKDWGKRRYVNAKDGDLADSNPALIHEAPVD
ncbi:von Willebrand factor type A domain-containing protein [Nemania abortiva]|nr:von Willebrand factor type A domain-containing protein [Nemania abortiva]